MFGEVNHVGSHTSERNGQGIKVDGVVIARSESFKKTVQVLALNDAATGSRQTFALFQQYAGGYHISVLFLTLTNTLQTQILTVEQQCVPVLCPDDGVEHIGPIADRVEASHNASHRGASDDIDGYAGLLDHFQGAYMGHALGAAATQHHSHFLTLSLRMVLCACLYQCQQAHQP